MKTEITPERQEHIVNYLMTNLSKKGVKMSHFAEMCGIDQVSLSKTKKESTRHLVSANAWNHLNVIYEQKSFDEVMQGACVRFTPSKGVRKEVIEKQRKVTEELMLKPSSFEKNRRLEAEKFEKMRQEVKHEEKTIEMPEPEKLIAEAENQELAEMSIKKIPDTKPALNNFPSAQLDNLHESEMNQWKERNASLPDSAISIGMAIDALIKAGAKINVSLEV